MIKVRNWIASIPEEEKHIAYVGEGKSETKEFLLCGDGWEAYKEYGFHLDMEFDRTSITTRDSRQVEQTTVNSTKYNEETHVNTEEVTTKETYTSHKESVLNYDQTDVAPLSKKITPDGILLTWTVIRQHTQLKGKLWANIRAVGTDVTQIKKSAVMVFEVDASIQATPASAPPISEFEQMESEMDALRQQACDAADRALNSGETAVMAADITLRHMQEALEAGQSAVAAAQEAAAIQTDLQHRLLPVASTEDNGKILTMVDGAAAWVEHTGGSGTGGTTTKLVPHTLSGATVTVTEPQAIDQPLLISTLNATKVFIGGNNWWPDGDLHFTHYVNNRPLPLTYPAGQYTVQANVQLTGESASLFCLLQLKDTTLEKTTTARLYLDGRAHHITVSHPFHCYSLFAGETNSLASGIEAQFTNIVLQYGNETCSYEPYCGVIHQAPVSNLTLDRVPTHVFADNQETLDVTYHTTETVVVSPTDDTTLPPSYYFVDDYLPNKVSTINTLMQSTAANGDAFIFITDQHTEQNKNAGQSPSLIRYIREHTKVRRLFSGGDTGLTQTQQIDYHEQMERAFDGAIHYAMGNHEYDRLRATDADLYYIHDINKPDQIGNAARHYYYVDNPQQKMRYVVVNNWESKGAASDGGIAGDLDVQAAWLTDTAFNVGTGWGIVVFCHQFFNVPDATTPSGTATAFMNAIDRYDGDGEILAVFHGHIHRDLINRTAGGVPVIGVTADKTDTSKESVVLVERRFGTITEQAFDVVIVDRTARKLHCVRIGAPAVDGSGAEGNPLTETRVVAFREAEE